MSVLLPLHALAARLGGMEVVSAAGLPFQAEIAYAANAEELAGLTARIAPEEDFSAQGIPYSPSMQSIRLALKTRADGTPVIHLSSAMPYVPPYPDLLVQLEWATGRSMRAYSTAPNIQLADAPVVSAPPAQAEPGRVPEPPSNPAQAAVEVAPQPAEEAVVAGHAPVAGTPKPAAPVATRAKPGQMSKTDFYDTRRGDTLHAIARKHRVAHVSLEQMSVALFRANQAAFARNNMHQLLAGKRIRLPQSADLDAITPEQAIEEIRLQTADWDAYRMGLAARTRASQAVPEQEGSQAVTGRVAAFVRPVVSDNASPRDVIRLSAGNGAGGKASLAEASTKIAALEDDLVAKSRALEEENRKKQILEHQVQNMEKLINLRKSLSPKVDTPPDAPKAKPAGLLQKVLTWTATLAIFALAVWFALRLKRRRNASA